MSSSYPSGHADQRALARLGTTGRILLTSDGTLTNLLEQLTGEQIVVTRLSQSRGTADAESAALLASAPDRLLSRSTRLVGAVTGTAYIDAVSTIAIDELPTSLRADLVSTEEPIGRLLRRHRIESFREMLGWEVYDQGRSAPEPHGRTPPSASRRYRVFTAGAPTLLIQEFFAASCFAGRAASTELSDEQVGHVQ